eukprot:365422-Chlamydomonas_euryale.AAC.3
MCVTVGVVAFGTCARQCSPRHVPQCPPMHAAAGHDNEGRVVGQRTRQRVGQHMQRRKKEHAALHAELPTYWPGRQSVACPFNVRPRGFGSTYEVWPGSLCAGCFTQNLGVPCNR